MPPTSWWKISVCTTDEKEYRRSSTKQNRCGITAWTENRPLFDLVGAITNFLLFWNFIVLHNAMNISISLFCSMKNNYVAFLCDFIRVIRVQNILRFKLRRIFILLLFRVSASSSVPCRKRVCLPTFQNNLMIFKS